MGDWVEDNPPTIASLLTRMWLLIVTFIPHSTYLQFIIIIDKLRICTLTFKPARVFLTLDLLNMLIWSLIFWYCIKMIPTKK